MHIREGVLPRIFEEYKKMEPVFKQIDKLQHLVDRVQGDMDAIGIYLNSSFMFRGQFLYPSSCLEDSSFILVYV